MLRVEGLSEHLRHQTLHNLWRVCGGRAALPESCLVTRQLNKLTSEPCSAGRYAEVWKGQTGGGEGSSSVIDVCIKVIKSEKIHKVGDSPCHDYQLDDTSQEFRGEVALWVKLDHPNILRCFGMVPKPPQIVMAWMPNGQAMEYVKNNKSADRVPLVSSLTLRWFGSSSQPLLST